MKLIKHTFPFIAAISIVFSSCSGAEKKDQIGDLLNKTDQTQETSQADRKLLEEIQQQIPSPIEMSNTIQASGAPYSPTLLNNVSNLSSYNTGFRKAINIGIFGTDLGYANLYSQKTKSVEYLKAILQLATDINVNQFFKVDEMIENQNNLEELVNKSNQSFMEMDAYLKDKNKGDLSSAILIGGYIEALYLTTKIYEKSTNAKETLKEKLADQKIILENIDKLAKLYEKNANFKDLITGIQELKVAYENVSITYEKVKVKPAPVEPIPGLEDIEMVGTPPAGEEQIIEQSIVHITDQEIKTITQKVEALRKKLI